MAIPTAPTLSSLVAEALRKAGHSSPDTSLTMRAQTQWMEEIKNDIFLVSVREQKRLRSLFATSHLIATVGVHRYSLPHDYSGDLHISILDGYRTGTLVGATASTVTFSVDEVMTEVEVQGKYILITSGLGMGSCSQIRTYNPLTLTASVTPDFTRPPVLGDRYRIITDHIHLQPTSLLQLDLMRNVTTMGRPTKYTILGDQDFGEVVFDYVPDKAYGIQLRYYVDLSMTDLTGMRISTLYRRWRNVFVQGVYAKALVALDDTRGDMEVRKYHEYLNLLVEEETRGQDLGEMQFQIER
ncbi:MAG: hypothetical protein DDT19_02596 [Syntrophomonadaceae bacterium]|nr:hypothetical protein [Bacillota bacterium]